MSFLDWSLLMGTSIVSPILFLLAFIRFISSLVGDEHQRESVILSVGFSSILGIEGGIGILVDPSALIYRYFRVSNGV